MKGFPMLGFPEETMLRPDSPYYTCRPLPARPEFAALVWRRPGASEFAVYIAKLAGPFSLLSTSSIESSSLATHTVFAADPLEAQMAIFNLIQNHLPAEVNHGHHQAERTHRHAA